MRSDIIAASISTGALQFNGGGTPYIVQKHGTSNTYYLFFVDTQADLMYSKSTDGGYTWANPIAILTGTIVSFALWYERWSGISGDLVHFAYTEGVGHDILYRSLNLASDALGTQTTVFAGASSATGGGLSIVAGRNGHLRVAGSIDAGAEDGAWSSTDTGATWGDVIADPSEAATQDQYFLLPGWNADTADVMLIFLDASANGLSVKRYDDSANTWTETAIIADTGLVDLVATSSFPHVSCFVDLANSRNVVFAWTAIDTLNADLRCFIITDTTITETATNVVLNSVDDQGLVAAGIDMVTGMWYVFYGGKSDGSETFPTSIRIYYKTSTDAGATWSSEMTLSSQLRASLWMACTPRFTTNFLVGYHSDLITDQIIVSANNPIQPRARMAIGVS